MANNPILYNAALAGVTGGINQRWLSNQDPAAYLNVRAQIIVFATGVDSVIATDSSVSEQDGNLIQAICQQVFAGRYPLAGSLTTENVQAISLAIKALYETMRVSLEVVPSAQIFINATPLNTLVGSEDGQSVIVAGRLTPGDGGQGMFTWDLGSVAIADQALIYGTTAFGRWLRIIGDTPIDPRWFGAVSAATINAALIAAQSLTVSSVLVPRGSYTIGGSGVDRILPLSNTQLTFEPGTTISTGALTADSYIILVDSTTQDVENVTIEGNGLILNCSQAEAFNGFGIGINIQNVGDVCRNIQIKNIKVQNARVDGVAIGGNAGPFMQDILLTGITCTGCGRNGMSITGQVDGATFIGCHFDDNGTISAPNAGVDVEVNPGLEIKNVRFVRCSFDRNLGNGLYAQAPTYGVTSTINVEDCQANSNATTGIVTRAVESTLFNCRAQKNGLDGFYISANVSVDQCTAQDNIRLGFSIIDENSRIDMSNCTAQFNGSDGFLINSFGGSTGITVLENCHGYANIDRGFNLSGAYNCSLNTCRATANGQEGIRMAGCWHSSVSDCWLSNNGQLIDNVVDNIILETASNLNRITNNTIRQSVNFQHSTAVSGSLTTVVLGSPSSDADDVYKGMLARIISGTGAGGSGTITDYDGATRTITVTWSPAVAPDATSVIEIVGVRTYLGPVASSTATIVTLPAELASSINDVFNGSIFNIVSGPGAGQSVTILDYDGATREVTVASALSPVPTFNSVVEIFACRRPRFGARINAGCIGNSLWGNDAYFAGATSAVSDGGTGTVTVATNRTS